MATVCSPESDIAIGKTVAGNRNWAVTVDRSEWDAVAVSVDRSPTDDIQIRFNSERNAGTIAVIDLDQ